jgi:hypothetical protein
MNEKEIVIEKVDDKEDLKAFSSENQLEVRGKKFEVAREQIPFDELWSRAEMLAKSTIVPAQYQRRPENVFIALDMASRMGLSPLVVMNTLYIIQGKPSFSGQAVIAMLKASPEFKDIEIHWVGEEGKDSYGAYVTATHVKSGRTLKGATVDIKMAKGEGWYTKSGSKWQTMPEMMLSYRAHTFFCRVYAPELMFGLQSTDEITDVGEKSEAIDPFAE